MSVVEVVGRSEFCIGAEVRWLARIGHDFAIACRTGWMCTALADVRRRAGILRADADEAAGGPQAGRHQQHSLAHDYSLQQDFLSVRNMAIASISTSNSGRHSLA